MKNLSNKGFTLVELLAVIVILAIIIVITIPSILTSTSGAKQSSFETAAKSIKKYLEDNYDACILNYSIVLNYDDEIFDSNDNCSLQNKSDAIIKNSGYSTSDIESVFISEPGKITVTGNDGGKFGKVTPVTLDLNLD